MDARWDAPTALVTLALVLVVLLVLWLVWHLTKGLRRPTVYAAPVAYGLDFSWDRPPIPEIKKHGYTFVCRYGCYGTSGKQLTPAEAQSYLDNGIDVVSNWEHEAAAALQGYSRGVSDALAADDFFAHCGAGPRDPVYFSVDWDCQPDEYGAVADYFRGIRDTLGTARTGAYGGKYVITRLFNDKLITYGWQTYAWSYGQWEGRAQLRQVLNNQQVGGAAVDFNEAYNANFGAWGQADAAPAVRGDGAVLIFHPTDKKRLDLFYVGPNHQVWHRWCHGTMDNLWTGKGVSQENLGGQIVVGTLTAAWNHDGSAVNIAGLGTCDGSNCPPGTGQYWGYIAYSDGAKSGWGSMPATFGQYPDTPQQPLAVPAGQL